MPISVTCTNCGKDLRIGDEVAGKRFKCTDCNTVLQAPPSPEECPKAPAAKLASRPTKRPRPQKRVRPRPKRDVDPLLDNLSSYDYEPAERSTQRRTGKQKRPLRESRPGAFKEFDRLVVEIAIFFIGFAVIIAALGTFMFFLDDAPSDPERHQRIFTGFLGSAGVLFVMGLLALSKSPTVIHILRPVNFVLAIGALLLTVLVGSVLLAILPLAFMAAATQLSKAVRACPRR